MLGLNNLNKFYMVVLILGKLVFKGEALLEVKNFFKKRVIIIR